MILEAIHKINPKAECTVKNGNLDTIEWHDGTDPIPKEEIEIALKEVQAEYDAKKYQRDRAKEYPSIVDQLDDIYHNGIDGWKVTIKAVKDKYPKG
tara:strand:+ start:216 stop:503 length:288 start_codon:yes stop_codon:yes gene_type:complete